MRRGGSRSPAARCSSMATTSSPTTSCARRSASSRARLCGATSRSCRTSDEHKRLVLGLTRRSCSPTLPTRRPASAAGCRAIDGAKMMVDARGTYRKALDRIKIEEFPDLAMDVLNRRSQRDLEFGRRIVKDRGRGHFAEAVKTMRAHPVDPGRQAGLQGRARPHAQQSRQRLQGVLASGPTERRATSWSTRRSASFSNPSPRSSSCRTRPTS